MTYKYEFNKMPSKKELEKILKGAKIEFKSSDTKETLYDMICMDNVLKKQVNICNLGDIHTSLNENSIMYKDKVYDRVCKNVSKNNKNISVLFKNRGSHLDYLVVVGTSHGSGLGGTSSWSIKAKKVKLADI